MARGSSLFENIFVSGGVLLADDVILKTIEIGNYFFIYCRGQIAFMPQVENLRLLCIFVRIKCHPRVQLSFVQAQGL